MNGQWKCNNMTAATEMDKAGRQDDVLLTKINGVDLNVHIQNEIHLEGLTFTVETRD